VWVQVSNKEVALKMIKKTKLDAEERTLLVDEVAPPPQKLRVGSYL